MVNVVINSTPNVINKILTYRVSPDLKDLVKKGSLVLVPIGKQEATGIVIDFIYDIAKKGIKQIKQVIETDFIPPKMLKLGYYLSERYFCPLGIALNTLVPPAMNRRLKYRWRWQPLNESENKEAVSLAHFLSPTAGLIADFLLKKKTISESQFSKFGKKSEIIRELNLLESHGLVKKEWFWQKAPRQRQRLWVETRPEAVEAVENLRKKAPRQAAILQNLLTNGPQLVSALTSGGGYSSLKRLKEQGLINFSEQLPIKANDNFNEINLNKEQQQSVNAIVNCLGKYKTFLLHGITGSGKTEVYLRSAREALKKGYQVLLLVPEHALIPQMLNRVRQELGEEQVAVIQGNLPDGERTEIWKKSLKGKIKIVIGTRAALFAPLPRLGLIILDEEHVSSYKQDQAPRYDAREVAIKRGIMEEAVVVFGSATPSTESYYLARSGRIGLLQLPLRVGNLSLPKVEIVDLRKEFRTGNHGYLSRTLKQKVSNTLRTGKQAILFLNRRGYAPQVICRNCGQVTLCDNCGIALTFHNDSTLRCHYCGHVAKFKDKCKFCGGKLARLGIGTQRLEEEVRALWPKAKILRADADTITGRGQWEKIYSTFLKGQADILIGTQTIAKGMDFPNVDVVGVINADLSLYQPDFRARERTFQILTQVAGRAGRKSLGGKVFIQTYNPDDPAIVLAAKQDYKSFYEQEIKLRKALNYPPFIKLVCLGFIGTNEARVIETAHTLTQLINSSESNIEVLGPVPGYPPRLNNNYRWQIMLKLTNWANNKKTLVECLKTFRNHSDIRIIVDVGPINNW